MSRRFGDTAYSEGATATPIIGDEAVAVVNRIFKDRLLDRSKTYEVILLCKLLRSVFHDDEWAEIVRRVAEDGTGLVWITPDGNKDASFFEASARAAKANYVRVLNTLADAAEVFVKR